uniref:DM13 domain-containing protein n=1 Tax=Dendroctonus ponderosae TaxID=77166 RepID=A0AAR5PDQ8_DENPD
MNKSRYLKMKVFSAILTCFCFQLSVQLNEGNSTSAVNQTIAHVNYDMDPQIEGFNSTNVTSGPIILADKKTLFIPDFRYLGKDDNIEFHALTEDSPYSNSTTKVPSEYIPQATSLNFYVILPEVITLDNIKSFQVRLKNQPLDYVIFDGVNKSAIKEFSTSTMEDSIFRVPKCCAADEYLNDTLRICSKARFSTDLDMNIFESNETGLDPDISLERAEYKLIPYYQALMCKSNEVRVAVEDLSGLIYNSSLIIQGYGILTHREYCIDALVSDNRSSKTITLYCVPKPAQASDLNFYLPVLILSTICFALSAAAYAIILKATDIHKRCFIMFSSSMCITFISLIVMQVQNKAGTCNFFGFVFLFTVIFSFSWLLILCLDLLYQVVYPIERKRYTLRWNWYCGLSLGVTLLLFAISLFSGELWVPDVPSSYIMNYGKTRCVFQTSYARAQITFVPLIISIIGASASLILIQKYKTKNQKDTSICETHDWISNANSYVFLSRTYGIIITVACFWLIDVFMFAYPLESGKTQLALDVIKAALGVVTFIGFVGNKYTRKELKKKFTNKKRINSEDCEGLNGIHTPTPDTQCEMDTFISNNHAQMTTFQNNR